MSWASVTPADVEAHVAAVIAANDAIGTTGPLIAPTPRQLSLGDIWTPLALQYARTTHARAGAREVLASILVEEAGLANWGEIEQWLDVATTLDLEGFYLLVGRRAEAVRTMGSHCPGEDVLTSDLSVERIEPVPGSRRICRLFWARGHRHGRRWRLRSAGITDNGTSPLTGEFRERKPENPIPRVTSAALMSPLIGIGEMSAVARSSEAARVLPNSNLRERMASRQFLDEPAGSGPTSTGTLGAGRRD